MIVAATASYLLGRRFTRPILSLKGQAQRLAQGDFREPHPEEALQEYNYTHELTELNDSFHTMRARLERIYMEIDQSNVTLTAILQSINDGVVAVDADGRVVLLTDRAEDYLGEMADSDDESYADGVAHYGDDRQTLALLGTNYAHINSVLSRSIEENARVSQTLTIPGPRPQVLEISAAPLSTQSESGAVAVVHDASRMTQLEQMRHDFVANVTHELKTPLTSIRGYVDLLRSRPRDAETAIQFYDIIEIEAERLETLIGDLLDLAEIESGIEARTEQIYLFQVVDEVMAQMIPIAEQNEVRLIVEVNPGMQVLAEYARMRQLLTNLVNNAVVYNKPGGSVTIRGRVERDMAIIQVEDDGIGIPEDAQERIFERFYRVSKDRSREAGGTGLGLSIVKHIVGSFGGTIELQSELGEGTLFTIRIPQPRSGMDDSLS